MTRATLRRLASLLLLAPLIFGGAGVRAERDLYDLLESAQEALDDSIRQATGGKQGLAYKLLPREEFKRLLVDVQTVLRGGDMEQLAEWLPNSELLLQGLDAVPGFEPYADWLRQRIDYFAVADKAVRSVPAPKPKPKPKARPRPAPAPKPYPPAKRPSPAPAPAAVAKRKAYAGSTRTWSKQLEGRKAPRRAAQLVPKLKRIFKDQGIPPELVWMAEVESTFNPAARSPAGAVGLFQLMPATAKHLGLQVKPDDQRLNPTYNGRAAAKYLSYLYDRFDDWPLAIAAYNGGEGRIGKLLKQQKAGNFDGIAGHLPGETRMYVPKVLATIELREGIDPAKLGKG